MRHTSPDRGHAAAPSPSTEAQQTTQQQTEQQPSHLSTGPCTSCGDRRVLYRGYCAACLPPKYTGEAPQDARLWVVPMPPRRRRFQDEHFSLEWSDALKTLYRAVEHAAYAAEYVESLDDAAARDNRRGESREPVRTLASDLYSVLSRLDAEGMRQLEAWERLNY